MTARRHNVNQSCSVDLSHAHDSADQQWQPTPGDQVRPNNDPIYNIQVMCNDGNTHLSGQKSSRGLKALIEAGASIIGDPKPVITEPTPQVLPNVPAPEDTLMARTARKVWVQKRLREYEAKWEPAEDVTKGLILQHEDLVASVIRYEDDMFYWAIVDKDHHVAGTDVEETILVEWGTGARAEGIIAGMTEGMIDASETLIKILDERAADANKRLGGEADGS